jgi:hypothetical protein
MSHYDTLPLDPADSLKFTLLRTFARFEYALKASGTYLLSAGGEQAAPNWKTFKADLKAAPDLVTRIKAECGTEWTYLAEHPPHHQKVVEGRLTFVLDKRMSEGSVLSTIECCKTIRNNLFHGGKEYPSPDAVSVERDKQLISAAIKVIDAMGRTHEALKGYYVGGR